MSCRFEPGAQPRQHGASATDSSTTASGGSGGGGGESGGDTLTINIWGTRAGVKEARRRLDLTIRRGGGGSGGGGGSSSSTVVDGASLWERGGDGGGRGSGRGRGGGMEHEPRGARGDGRAAEAVASVEVTLRGVPENLQAARIDLADLDCLEVVVPLERKSLPAIFGAGGANLQKMEVKRRALGFGTAQGACGETSQQCFADWGFALFLDRAAIRLLVL